MSDLSKSFSKGPYKNVFFLERCAHSGCFAPNQSLLDDTLVCKHEGFRPPSFYCHWRQGTGIMK
ncbi:MAG TPA: hypothetical protein DDW77_12895 [Verrucomicrobiales bacterium]|nr:hypothetical protein [Verrucomicrobiales bacterium]